MKRMQQAIRNETRWANRVLAHKPVYRDEALADGIDREEETFESDGAEQGWTLRSNKARGRDFVAVQSQACFGYGPNVPLPASDHDALRAGRSQLKFFRQRSWYHAKCSASIHEKLNFLDTPGRAGEMALYVEQSHSKSPLKNTAILAQPPNNATTLITGKMVARTLGHRVELPTRFEWVINLKSEKQIGVTIPQWVLMRADRVIK
jgi:hypothetical protein